MKKRTRIIISIVTCCVVGCLGASIPLFAKMANKDNHTGNSSGTGQSSSSASSVEEHDIDEEFVDGLPKAYCMRDDYLMHAQHQDKNGLCWDFASTMAASTTLMKATNEYYDFSEAWTALSCYYPMDFCSTVGAGGAFTYQKKAMYQCGLMLETDLPYQNSYLMSTDCAEDYYNFYSKYANNDLADLLVSDDSTTYKTSNVRAIKEHIYNYGSLYLSFGFKTGFLEKDGVCSLTPNQTEITSNHAVSLIGWDDSYEKEFYFDGSDTPTVFKGAWIVLNSYTENNAKDGIALIFYEDENIDSITGYRYEKDTSKSLYFYDKIEEGYRYPTNVKGKYYSKLLAKTALTKQLNVFYDDVYLEYSYEISDGAEIKGIEIYLNNQDVTNAFSVTVDATKNRFYIDAKNTPEHGQYKVLVRYGNGEDEGTYLNNFFVTHGLLGEKVEFDYEKNGLAFSTGKDLEYYSYATSDKDYVIYTNQIEGTVSFVNRGYTSIFSEKDMNIPDISYKITDGKSCRVSHTITANNGYALDYNFTFIYCEDLSMQQVRVYYDLGGGTNHLENDSKELANEASPLVLYEPSRPGYTFAGWYLDYGNCSRKVEKVGNEYQIEWEDIIHIGENPKVYASGYYDAYYKNSNVVFVYARWEEIEYHNVHIDIVGEGTVQVGEDFSLSENDAVTCVFTPNWGWGLTAFSINGVDVEIDELKQITKNGLRLEGLSEDVSIEATFMEGTMLYLTYGENIQDAYLTKNDNGETIRFNHGEFIPAQYIKISANFFLWVEVIDGGDAFVYEPESVSSYTPMGKNLFNVREYIYSSDKCKEINIGSAVAKTVCAVDVSYTVNEHVLDHYIAMEADAQSGSQHTITAKAGDIVYLFLKKPEDTLTHRYSMPQGFVKVGGDWYKKAIYVPGGENRFDLGEIRIYQYNQSGGGRPFDPPFDLPFYPPFDEERLKFPIDDWDIKIPIDDWDIKIPIEFLQEAKNMEDCDF